MTLFFTGRNARHLAIYLGIGSLVFVLDTGSFQLMILAKCLLPIAATVSYALATVVHFNLNRVLNFRNFDRAIQDQFITYAVIVAFGYLVTMIIIEGSVHAMGANPFVAKIAAIVVNIPLGFLSHRYLTFGPGIVAAIRQMRKP